MQNMKFSNNGVEIPNESTCIWCGGNMHRGGGTFMGSGINSFTMWCENCGSITHHAKDSSRRISGFDIKFEFKE